MSKVKKWFFIYIPAVIIALFVFLHAENNSIGITTYRISSEKLPEGFDTYRIVQLSDLQSKMFGRDQRPLIRKVEKLRPDLIVVTGDLADANHYNEEASLQMMAGVAKIAPVYFARGNHEFATKGYAELEVKLLEAGVHVLQNQLEPLPLGDGVIRLVGVDDPIFNKKEDGDVAKMVSHLEQAFQDNEHPEAYTILLSHRPELFHVYAEYGIDLSLTGHAHGGQFRVPFLGGVYSPEQGFWPNYSEGLHQSGDYSLIVNRGLGNSTFPQRIFNRPEIVLVELTRDGAGNR